jgi:glycoslytransferase
MYKLSVIIPIYNVEQYLRKCLDSVCNQTLEDIEIICINDCSPDNSLEILKEYQKNDNRIKIIDFKENRGVAAARNEAIKIAKGEYIGFVDGDDWVDLDFYEKLYKKAKEDNVDLVIGNLLKNNQGKNSFLHNMANRVKQNKIYFSGLFWLGIYSTKLIRENNLSFTEGLKYGEDRLFPILAAYYTKKVSVVDNVYYYYFTRDDSATVEFYENNDKVKDFIESSKLILQYLNQLNYKEVDYKIFIKEYLFDIIITFLKAPKCNQTKLKELYFFCITNLKYPDLINIGFEKNVFEAMTNNDMVALSKFVQLERKSHLVTELKQYLNFKKRGANV